MKRALVFQHMDHDHPGRFLEIITTGRPRDRDSRIAERPEFGNVTAHLWSLLRNESLRAMGSDKATAA